MPGRAVASFVLALAMLSVALQATGAGGDMSTRAGNGVYGYGGDGGPAAAASMTYVVDVAADAAGNLYIADHDNLRIRRVTPSGIISTFAGRGTFGFCGDGGPAVDACFRFPQGLAIDAAGNVFIGDTGNNRVRRVDAVTGIISTYAGNGTSTYCGDNGPAANACLNAPVGLALDAIGNLYIADSFNCRIRKVAALTTTITTVAGTGLCAYGGDDEPPTLAYLAYPHDVAIAPGGAIYIADQKNHRVRKVESNVITTVAGHGTAGSCGDGGPAVDACLREPRGVALDGGSLYIADSLNHRIRRVDGGIIQTVAGNGTGAFCGDGGPATSACLKEPAKVLAFGGELLIADAHNFRLRAVACIGAPGADGDCDGVADASDNCVTTPNPGQENADGDLLGDACDPDDDGDGYSDALELAEGSDPLNPGSTPDTDSDGIFNNNDNCPSAANPLQADFDGDNAGDVCDLDDDGDGYSDALELAEGSDPLDPASTPDSDADGVTNSADNCPSTANPLQTDTDGDGAGDACDDDDDGDGFPDALEIIEATDPLDALSTPDPDLDGVLNSADNCTLIFNPQQTDTDDDSAGDACDNDDDDDGFVDALELSEGSDPLDGESTPDPDGDGVLNSADNCDLTPNSAQLDFDADAAGDACDSDDDGDGCGDVHELGPNPVHGGDRSPLDAWDYFDVTGDRAIDLQDVLDVLRYFGDPGTSPEGNRRDRYAPDPFRPWRTAAANNGVDAKDALLALQSFGHVCASG